MREIKFRVWDKGSNRFLDENDNVPNFLSLVPCETTGEFTPMYMEFEQSKTYKNTDLEVNQFTGLLDCHGKEIYEGDVVTIEYQPFGAKRGWSVEYDEGEALFVVVNKADHLDPVALAAVGELEIIGNIYEKGSMLK